MECLVATYSPDYLSLTIEKAACPENGRAATRVRGEAGMETAIFPVASVVLGDREAGCGGRPKPSTCKYPTSSMVVSFNSGCFASVGWIPFA